MNTGDALPAGRLLCWYGDDFTGATAVMEVMSFAGLSSVLFFAPPTAAQLKRFPDARAIGIAGTARSQSPQWMDAQLPAVFETMAGYDAAINHYKICSTLDSSPDVGSIGRASELAGPVLGGDWHSFLVAAPPMQRYQVFGNLFAGIDGTVHRLDRHPVMRRHPVTPMDEADVRQHLARQTALPLGLVDITALSSGQATAALQRERAAGAAIIALDCLDEASLVEAGRLIWEQRGTRHLSIGSQGVEYALVAYWREMGWLADATPPAHPGAADHVLVISGSCSAINARQIEAAADQGFALIRLSPAEAIAEEPWQHELDRVQRLALQALEQGRDPLVYTSLGPDDPANAAYLDALDQANASAATINARVGTGLGALLLSLIETTGITRCAIAGGDTSGYGASQLQLFALTTLAPIATGAALCQAYSDNPALDQLQIALKGGQMGGVDFFAQVRNGGLGPYTR